jgi:hypothetical protein
VTAQASSHRSQDTPSPAREPPRRTWAGTLSAGGTGGPTSLPPKPNTSHTNPAGEQAALQPPSSPLPSPGRTSRSAGSDEPAGCSTAVVSAGPDHVRTWVDAAVQVEPPTGGLPDVGCTETANTAGVSVAPAGQQDVATQTQTTSPSPAEPKPAAVPAAQQRDEVVVERDVLAARVAELEAALAATQQRPQQEKKVVAGADAAAKSAQRPRPKEEKKAAAAELEGNVTADNMESRVLEAVYAERVRCVRLHSSCVCMRAETLSTTPMPRLA